MYNDYFGFRESPFSLTPNPSFFYINPVYLEAYANLRYAIDSRRGFISLTGEVGTGKTTLLRKLMHELKRSIRSAFVFNTHLEFEALLELILSDLGAPAHSKTKAGMLADLNSYLLEQHRAGATVCLLLDEAQNLSDEALEGVRLLSNFETDHEKLLQIVLMGQPELKSKLDRPNLRQLKQRIAMHCEITPLDRKEVGAYIDFRLRAADYPGNNLFSREAIEEIARFSRGIPRLINVLCDNSLLIAFAASERTISAEMVREAARDLRMWEEAATTRSWIGNGARGESPPVPSGPSGRRGWFRRILTRVVMIATLALLLAAAGVISFNGKLALFTDPAIRPALLRAVNGGTAAAVPRQQATAEPQPLEIASVATKLADVESKTDGSKRLTVARGWTAYEIATQEYGPMAVLGLDLIKEFNPRIINLNWIAAGERIVVPPLTAETLVRARPDGSYRVIVGSFLNRRDADALGRRMEKSGYRAAVTPSAVSNDLLLQRVEIEGLTSPAEAAAVLEMARQDRWSE